MTPFPSLAPVKKRSRVVDIPTETLDSLRMQRHLQESSAKRMKSCYPNYHPMENTEDRISNLPDSICSHILSFLLTADAAKTSVLSRRWRYMWNTVTSLDFDFINLPKSSGRRIAFVEFVTRSLVLHDGLDIRRFRLQLLTYRLPLPSASYWISFAVRHRVEELELSIPKAALEKLPDLLFTSESLKVLKLELPWNILKLPHSVRLDGLNALHLVSISFHNDSVLWELVLGCPSLEELILQDCNLNKIKVLDICADELQRLRIIDCNNLQQCEIKISAPSLQSFKYASPVARNFSLKNLVSLTSMDIDFRISCCSLRTKDSVRRSANILGGLDNVKVLSLSAECIEYLFIALESLAGLPSHLHNMRHLKLAMWSKKCYIRVVACLLKSCPILEILSVETVKAYHKLKLASKDGDVKKTPRRCLLDHLRTIEMKQFEGVNKLELVKFLIKNAKVLEKIITVTHDGEIKETTFAWMKGNSEAFGSSLCCNFN